MLVLLCVAKEHQQAEEQSRNPKQNIRCIYRECGGCVVAVCACPFLLAVERVPFGQELLLLKDNL